MCSISLFPRVFSSAYNQFSRINNSLVRDDLIKEGKDSSLGPVMNAMSLKVNIR